MDVHLRHGRFDRPQNVAIVKLWKVTGKAALDADFGCANIPCLDCFLRHLVECQEISVVLARAAAESAELTSHKTHIRKIDIAIDNVGDDVSDQFGAQDVGSDEQSKQIIALRVGECVRLFQREIGAILRLENSFQRRSQGRSQARGDIRPVELMKRFEVGVREFARCRFAVHKFAPSSIENTVMKVERRFYAACFKV